MSDAHPDAFIQVSREDDVAQIIVPGPVLEILGLGDATGTELRNNLLDSLKTWLRMKYLTADRLRELTEQLEQIRVLD